MRVGKCVLGLVAIGLLTSVHAAPVRAGLFVYSPNVEPGELGVELKGQRGFDGRADKNGVGEYKTELEYGVTDRWMTSLEGEWAQNNEDNALYYSASGWENIFQFFPQGENWLDSGLFVEYEKPSSSAEPDSVEARLLLEKTMGRWVHTANLVFTHDVGTHASGGTGYGYAWRSEWLWKRQISPGFEAHGTFGTLGHTFGLDRQSQQAGPVLYGAFSVGEGGDTIKYEAGYLLGLTSETARSTFKGLVEYETHF